MEHVPTDLDKANTVLAQAHAIRQLRDAGYDPASVVKAVADGDLHDLRDRDRGAPAGA